MLHAEVNHMQDVSKISLWHVTAIFDSIAPGLIKFVEAQAEDLNALLEEILY